MHKLEKSKNRGNNDDPFIHYCLGNVLLLLPASSLHPNDHIQRQNSFPDQTRNEEKLVKPVFRLVDTGCCFSLKHMVIAVISYTPDTVICQCLSKMITYALCRFHGILYIMIYKIKLFFEMKASEKNGKIGIH